MQAHEVCKTNISEAQYLALVLIDGVLSGSLSMWKYVLRGDDCTTCSPTDLPQNKITKFFEKKNYFGIFHVLEYSIISCSFFPTCNSKIIIHFLFFLKLFH